MNGPILIADLPAAAAPAYALMQDGVERTTELILGEQKLRAFAPEIRALRLRCAQRDDLTTDPEYFIARNSMRDRRPAAVLIRRNLELEACVLFFEHCRFGVGLGIFRGGDAAGDGLIAGPKRLRAQYVHLAVQSLLQDWRIFGVGLVMRTSLDRCIELMGPEGRNRMFFGTNPKHVLPLPATYRALLNSMGPRTRKSLAGKRQQLENSANVIFLPSLEDDVALQAMLQLQPSSAPIRAPRFYHARYRLLRQNPEFFNMGMLLPDGAWLSILSGWRRDRVTYIDLQMNNMRFKKESLSAVMRAFMLEHEITARQERIHFVGGTSLLLRRYCQPTEPSTEVFLERPCLRARLFQLVLPHMNADSLYRRVKDHPEV